ncbi:DUF1566 domain-containing protein [Pulveribacter sp.]|uniref:DUF1566 domain-containing protein n=2 Tax=Pulveribacter sp. TaxID=2678893 RepID=UPI0028AA3C93|nr:DUF1566 domain-containing protein [Pulveribacter sp.]
MKGALAALCLCAMPLLAHAGYTKVSNSGSTLPDTAAPGTGAGDWACTRDDDTQLIWEVKTTSGLRNKDNLYQWQDGPQFAQSVNAAGLCGATDWRMPTKDELLGIVDLAQASPPKINPFFFPNTEFLYWSASPHATSSAMAWGVNFSHGGAYDGFATFNPMSARLVRGEPSPAPLLTALGVQGVTHNAATLRATSSIAGTGWWQLRPRGSAVPSPAQVKAGGQSFAMAAGNPVSRAITGLSVSTAYDLYLVAEAAGRLSTLAGPVPFTTATPVNGACAGVAASATQPSSGLCAAGTATGVTGSHGQWSWGCNGSNGGTSTSAQACIAPYASQTLSLSAGASSLAVGATRVLTASSTSGLPVSLVASGPCTLSGHQLTGTDAGSCTVAASQAGTGDSGALRYLPAPDKALTLTVQFVPVTGACGSADGVAVQVAPTAGLCTAGTAGAVDAVGGRFSWACTGAYGGGNAQCSAPGLWAIATTAGSGGTLACAPNPVPHSGDATCTATPGAGHRLAGWTGDCAASGASACQLAGVDGPRSAGARFIPGAVLDVAEGPHQGQPLLLDVSPGQDWQLAAASTATAGSVGTALPQGVSLPHGVVSVQLHQGVRASAAEVVLTYPMALPPGTVYYKFGPTRDDAQPHWYPYAGARIQGNRITLTLTDGGAGDSDLAQDGAIQDPGGPALLAGLRGAQAIPTLGQCGVLLLSALAALLGLRSVYVKSACRH